MPPVHRGRGGGHYIEGEAATACHAIFSYSQVGFALVVYVGFSPFI
jgi:hypothetical protein